ncbi:MAG: DNA-processing protein DprA [Proteobacteria bacterium]|nr:MAG: DNA-processing protein DprA [Pseudomonadota bacterium]
MQNLLLAHRYFHFSLSRWVAAWDSQAPDERDLERLFKEDIFPRRCLKWEFPHSLSEAREVHLVLMERELRMGVKYVFEGSMDYPAALLSHIPPERRPAVLYTRGSPLPSEAEILSVVGTRSPSPDGIDAARSFSAFFSLLRIHLVSGLAKGIDTIAHRENLNRGTIAVLGSSLNDIYPAENFILSEEILAQGGTLLSPFPGGQVPLPANFPQRNELIAALSTGVLVVEGAEKSGAAITGKLALAMGKSVAVLSSDFRTPFGRGAVRLAQAGADFVLDEEEALQALYARLGGFLTGELPLGGTARRKRSFNLSEFCARSGLDIPPAISLLQEEILKGRIVRTGPDRYQSKV